MSAGITADLLLPAPPAAFEQSSRHLDIDGQSLADELVAWGTQAIGADLTACPALHLSSLQTDLTARRHHARVNYCTDHSNLPLE